ncbi:hypothetical protein BH23GEM9_BH23GEM9_19670 [soil metagenome]
MNILETITSAQGGAAVNQLAAQFGVKPEQAQSAMAALMPALAAGLQRNMATESGLSSLLAALGRDGHDAYLEDPNKLAQPTTTADGNAILGHVLGSKDVSRKVAANASQQTGIDTAILKKMLPLVATLAMAALARQTKSSKADAAGGAGLAGILGGLLGRGDSSMLGDVGGIIGGMLGGRKRG